MQITKICSNRGSTKRRNPQSGNGNGITATETETENGICERRFQAIELKKNISNDNKINRQIKKETQMNKLAE